MARPDEETQPQRVEGPADVGERPCKSDTGGEGREREDRLSGPQRCTNAMWPAHSGLEEDRQGGTGRASKEKGGRGRAPAGSPSGVKSAASDPFPMFRRGMFEALRHRERCPMTPCVSRKESRIVPIPNDSLPPLQSLSKDLRERELSAQGEFAQGNWPRGCQGPCEADGSKFKLPHVQWARVRHDPPKLEHADPVGGEPGPQGGAPCVEEMRDQIMQLVRVSLRTCEQRKLEKFTSSQGANLKIVQKVEEGVG